MESSSCSRSTTSTAIATPTGSEITESSEIMIIEEEPKRIKRRSFVVPQILSWLPAENVGDGILDKHFKIQKFIGDGGSANVFKAQALFGGGIVAIKRIPRKGSATEEFNTEATMLSNMDHPGIIRFINAAMDRKNYYLVCEYAGGGDLLTRVLKYPHGRMPEHKACVIIRRLLRTVAYLHSVDIYHRDLKPENIVFMKDKPYHPKLIDFAMAAHVPAEKQKEVITSVCGTPFYVAPERWSDYRGYVLGASEMWSIGIIAYEIVCGSRVFVGDSMQGLRDNICEGKYKFASKVSSDFQHFIKSLLVVDHKQRMTAKQALKHPWITQSR